MANYTKVHENPQAEEIWANDTNKIKIICDEKTGIDYFKDDVIQGSNNISVYELRTGEMGGGGDLPTLSMFVYAVLGITISVTVLIGKGFFDEIGRELAKSLFQKFKELPDVAELYIHDKDGKNLQVLIPSQMTIEDCNCFAQDLENFSKNPPKDFYHARLSYDNNTKKIVVISIN